MCVCPQSRVCAARRPGKWTRRRRRYGLLRLLSPSCSGVGCCLGPRSDVAEEDDRPSAMEDELGGRSKHDPSERMSTEARATVRAFATGGGGCRRPPDSETGRGGASDRRGPDGARRGSHRSSRGHRDSEHGAR